MRNVCTDVSIVPLMKYTGLSQLLSNLTNYEGIEDDDVLLDIALTISRSYGSLSTASLIVKNEIQDIEGE